MKKPSITTVISVGIIVFFVAFIGYLIQRPDPRTTMTSRELLADCTTDMATQYHIHPNLKVVVSGEVIDVPQNIGIDFTRNCMSALHTHESNGKIHVESPVKKDFTLGDFFYNWNEIFNKDQIFDYQVDAEHGIKMTVDGVESKEFENLVFQDKQQIVIEYYKL